MKVQLGKYSKQFKKSKIQIDKFDVWSLDHTLAEIILPCLLQLKDVKHGLPNEFVDVGGADYDAQQSFDFYTETHSEAWEMGSKRWDEVLDKMIWSFYQIAYVDYESLYHHGKGDYEWIKTDKQFANPITGKMEDTFQIVDKSKNSWFDHVGLQLHMERIQEGIDLFAKYYFNLWD